METKEMSIVAPEGYEVDKKASTFEKIVFKKIEKYSKTWEEFCERNKIIDKNECYIGNESGVHTPLTAGAIHQPFKRDADFDKNFIPSKFAKPMLALMQLLTIREKEYTRGWEPDWNNDKEDKYTIDTYNSHITINYYTNYVNRPLSFPTYKMAEEFSKNWSDLLKIAKPLL